MRILKILFCLVAISFGVTAFADTTNDPTGYWLTISDKDGTAESVMQIWQTKDGSYSGKIAHIIPIKGHKEQDICHTCTGERAGKPIIGMVILSNLKADPSDANLWNRGNAFDPDSNKTYSAKMWLADNGQKLKMRGFLGISMLGRTVTWLRVKDLAEADKVAATINDPRLYNAVQAKTPATGKK